MHWLEIEHIINYMVKRHGHGVVPNILAMHKLIMDYYRNSWGEASLWELDRDIFIIVLWC